MCDIYIKVGEKYYPENEYSFSPSIDYPEYLFEPITVAKEDNFTYDMVRDCLIGLGLDSANIGNTKWNPFKNLISEGNTVIIKPNLVMHKNGNKKNRDGELDCLITHPSVVRAICDYCLIALNGTGKIIIGDAPMQGCDFNLLLINSGYKNLIDFYRKNNIEQVVICDFREYQTIFDKNKIIVDKKYNTQKCTDIELGIQSQHYEDASKKRYQVSDYLKEITNKFHSGLKHVYSVNKTILEADVVINVCKPKCHRLAGMTGAMKNLVGIVYNKACLPHRTIGSKQEGGDEYLEKSYVKKIISFILNKKISCENQKKIKLALIMRYIYGCLYYYVRFCKSDKYLIGSWYGNDTIWRTVSDLNYILKFADKNGNICSSEQRKVFHIADMVIAGEGNGPISPEPKPLGLIIAGNNAAVIDRIICEIMGFDYYKIPGLDKALNNNKMMLKDFNQYYINSNYINFCGMAKNIIFPTSWYFRPHEFWKDNIEK